MKTFEMTLNYQSVRVKEVNGIILVQIGEVDFDIDNFIAKDQETIYNEINRRENV